MCGRAVLRYILSVAISSMSADEIRAAAETHSELPPEYQNAVIESFIAKVDREIDARVDARLASHGRMPGLRRPRSAAFFVLTTLVMAIPLSAIAAPIARPTHEVECEGSIRTRRESAKVGARNRDTDESTPGI